MTCQHCQTWILDDEHRCHRCGRRVRSASSRISPATYPIAATAAAPAYDEEPQSPVAPAMDAGVGQQPLFSGPIADPRVIPFDTLTSPGERRAIRQRALESRRPESRSDAASSERSARLKRSRPVDQGQLEFGIDEQQRSNAVRSATICDAPVATAGLRVQAAVFDALLMGCAFGPGAAMFLYAGGHWPSDKHVLPFLIAALLTVPLLYKLLWAFAGENSPGTKIAGLELVDFDGRPPTKRQRYGRLLGSILSLLAAGIGMLWALVDEDKLTWHDHMSGTFPTFAGEVAAQESV